MENKKKILIFSTAYFPFVGGAEVAVKEITDRLGEYFDFDMITLRFDKKLPPYEKIGNVGVYRIGLVSKEPTMSDLLSIKHRINKLIFPFLSWWKAGDLYSEKQYDIAWSVMASFSGFGALFFKISHKEVNYLLTLQEGDDIKEIKKKVWFVYPLFSLVFKKADFIQTISEFLKRWAIDMGAKCPVEVVPNGVDIERFCKKYSAQEIAKIRESLTEQKTDKLVITTSRLVKKNAVDDVIKSLNYLPDSYKFVILGDGPDKDDLKKLVQDERVQNRVKFLGSVGHNEIPKYLRASDVFVRPSLSEGFGNSFVEAMVCDIPVVATPVGGIVDFLKEGETGLFCEPRNHRCIAEKIRTLVEDENLKNKVTKNAKKMVLENYDWNIIARDMKTKVFDKII